MRYVWIALSSLAVVAAVGAGVLYLQGRDGESVAEAPPGPPGVAAEEHYYVLLSLVEVEPRDGDSSWDTGGSPPDLYYRIRWQGQEVFRSSTKKDTLVAKWSNVAVDLGDVVNAVSLDDSIKAARITAREGSTLEFEVFDEDVARDDLVGSWSVPVADLRVGDQTWSRPGGRVVSAQCRVLSVEDVGFESLTR